MVIVYWAFQIPVTLFTASLPFIPLSVNAVFSYTFYVELFFPPHILLQKEPNLTWTWVETLFCLAIVNFGICWASIFSNCVGELLLAVASKRVTHMISHASIGVWLVSRGRLAPLLSTTCLLNWCQPVCHCVCSIAAEDELLSHSSQCWCLLLISAPIEKLTSSVTKLNLHCSSFVVC